MESERPGCNFKKTEYFMGPSENYSNLKRVDNASDIGDDMSDRVYTIDSIHDHLKAPIGLCDDYVATPRDIVDVGDTNVKKLQMRLQVLEADRESMKQTIISMRINKAQLILLKEIAQHLCKDMLPERRLPVKKPSRSFSLISLLKWIMSFVFWRKRARHSKFMCDIPKSNAGLLLLLEDGADMRTINLK
ncbi:hypothetical protein GIB67_017740 [Kingdonia uniflora]|uniref:Uncharacterized protein n=1 Tax=Kingdonia uniflora TaxID=39325 RepID=A0A7J7LPY3_9MAGN|nr:hypothetical protein GIB67_017740 [Kingdonia uniflora]